MSGRSFVVYVYDVSNVSECSECAGESQDGVRESDPLSLRELRRGAVPPELALEDAPSAPPMFFEDEDGAPEPGPSVPRAPPLDLPRYEP